MRLIGEFDDAQAAARFSAFLITAGIAAKAESTSAGAEVWALEEDQFPQAVAELEKFRANPDDTKYAAAVSQATKISRAEADRQRRIQKKIVVGTKNLKPKPQLTIVLIAISVIVSLITNFGADPQHPHPLFKALQFVSVPAPESKALIRANDSNYDSANVRLASIKRGEIWRLFTLVFLHLSGVHLVFNMLWLFQLGSLIENRYGWPSLLSLVLLTAAIPNVAQCVVPEAWGGSQPKFTADHTLLTAVGGMSGVVYGLLGFVWIRATFDRNSGFHLSEGTIIFMLGWLVFCMVPGLTERLFQFNVANWAHGVGLLVGCVAGYWPELKKLF